MKITTLFLLTLQFIGCVNSQNSGAKYSDQMEKDTIIRPTNISQNAWLKNMGFEDKPVYFWIEYIGNLEVDGNKYSHIFGFEYLDEEGKEADTLYYEFSGSRDSIDFEDVKGYELILFPGNATIKLTDGKKEFILYHVIENHDFDRIFKGVSFCRIPTIQANSKHPEHGLVAAGEIEFNLERIDEQIFLVTLLGGGKQLRKINYQLNNKCTNKLSKVSYLNRENGRIYFVEKDCFLELSNPSDLSKI